MLEVQSPFPQFADTAGDPLDAGYIYIGTVDENPETDPIAVYWDFDATQPAAQPLRTHAGYIVRGGTPGRIFTEENDYSSTVRDRRGRLVYTTMSTAVSAPFLQAGTGAVVRSMQDKARENISVLDYAGTVGNGVVDDTDALERAIQWINELIALNDWQGDGFPCRVRLDGQGKQYLVSRQITIGTGISGLHMHDFTFIASDSFESNTGTITIDHDTGYITPTGTLKAVLFLGGGAKAQHTNNTFERIYIDCRAKCDGIYSTGTQGNRLNNIEVRHAKRYGGRFYGESANTECKLSNIKAMQWTFDEAEGQTFTAVGWAFESADMMESMVVANNNKVDLYYDRSGSHSLNQAHVYQHYVDATDTTKFPQIQNATDSGVANTTASGNKIRIQTYTAHGRTTGDRVFVGYLPGITSDTNGSATLKWSTITVQSATTYDCNETTHAGTFVPWSDTVTFTGGASANIVYAGVDGGASVSGTITFQTSGALPAEITAGTTYYVKTVNTGTNTITISATDGGAAITFATAGTGTHTVYWRTWTPRVYYEGYQPLGIWVSPRVHNITLQNIELDGVRLRNYSREIQIFGVRAKASSSVQRVGYPWFDHRVITASDNLDGIMIRGVSILTSTISRGTAYAQGSGSIVTPLHCSIADILLRTGNSDDTQAYAEIVFGTNITNSSATGLVGTPTGTITVNGTAVNLSVAAATVPTLLDLITYVEGAVVAAALGVTVDGWVNTTEDRIRFRGSSSGATSTLSLSGNIFSGLTNFSSLPTPTAGVDDQQTMTRGVELQQLIAHGGSATDPAFVFSYLDEGLSSTSNSVNRKTGMYSPARDQIGHTINGTATTMLTADGFGYPTGVGGTVTQGTSKSTTVVLSKLCGQITMHAATLNADTTVSFTLTNTHIAAGDRLMLSHDSAGTAGAYLLNAQCGSGSATVNVRNITAGNLGEAIVIGFTLLKGATA